MTVRELLEALTSPYADLDATVWLLLPTDTSAVLSSPLARVLHVTTRDGNEVRLAPGAGAVRLVPRGAAL